MGSNSIHVNEANDQCDLVGLDEIISDSSAYDGQYLCTEGYIRVAYEGMAILPTKEFLSDYTDDAVSAPLGYAEALRQGYRTGDRVRLEGTLSIDRDCLGLNDTGDEETFCIGPPPRFFLNPRMSLIQAVRARDECIHVGLDEVYEDPFAFHNSMICTEGIVNRVDHYDLLVPDRQEVDLGSPLYMSIRQRFLGGEIRSLIPGERLDVAGLLAVTGYCFQEGGHVSTTDSISRANFEERPACVAGLSLQLYDMRVEAEIRPAAACETRELTTLLARPLDFASQLICTDAYLLHEDSREGYYTMALYPSEDTETDIPLGPARVHSFSTQSESVAFGRDGHIRLIGFFAMWEECLRQGAPTPMPSKDSATECDPMLEFDVIEAHYISKEE